MIKKHSSRYDEIVPHILLVNMYIYTFLLDKNLAMCITYAKQHTTWALKMNLIVIQSFYYWKPILREKNSKMKTTPFPKDIHGNNIYNKEVLETA